MNENRRYTIIVTRKDDKETERNFYPEPRNEKDREAMDELTDEVLRDSKEEEKVIVFASCRDEKCCNDKRCIGLKW